MKRRVTMSDIARRAGVHTTTVSMALRNHRNLPARTIERIKRLAEEMGYRPDPTLNALNAYRHGKKIPSINATLAYLTNWGTENGWRESPAHLQFFNGAVEHAERLGYKVDHFWLGDPERSPRRLNDILQSRGIRGLVFASCPPNNELNLALEWSRFTGIKIDYSPLQLPLHSVTNDQLLILQLAFQKVIEKGYRRVGLVMPRLWDNYVKRAYSTGFIASQQSLNSRERIPMLVYDPPAKRGKAGRSTQVPADLLKGWLAKHKPEVVLSYLPYIDETFNELNIRLGVDIGYADLFLEPTDGTVAGVVNQCDQVSRVAVELLVDQIHQNALGFPPVQTRTLVEGIWMDGATLPGR